LGVSIVLLIGFAFVLTAILLEDSELYTWYYNATHRIQPIIVYFWFLALVLSPTLALTFSLLYGAEMRKTIQWKISIIIMVLAGLPSLVLVLVGLAMHYL
jgi:hypothetical protein